MMKFRRLLTLLLAITALLLPGALGEEETPQLLHQQVDADAGSVSYPQLSGLSDAVVQQQANAAILSAGQVEERITRLQSLSADSVGLTQSYEALLSGNVLSVVFSAHGALQDSGFTHQWSSVNLDLTTGENITLADLFTDEAAARQAILDYMEQEVAPNLSAHLEAGQLTPLPDCFGLSAEGITFYYDLERFTTLSGQAGQVTLLYTELRDLLKLGEGAILTRLGAEEALTLNQESAEKIRSAVEAGQIPGIPAVIGENLAELFQRYPLRLDPDYYPDGCFFYPEDDAFRGAYVLASQIAVDAPEQAVVQGIRTDRANFFGLCTGLTTQAEWRAILGEPDASVTLDEDTAYAYYLEIGVSDYYNFGGHQLRLHAGADGTLRNIFITQ